MSDKKEKIAVFGAGTIGACQATLLSGNGYPTVVIGHSEKGLERCKKTMEQNWDDLISNGLATEENKRAAMALTEITNDPTKLSGIKVVFEAVAEYIEVKKSVYAIINEYCDGDVVIASTTSSIDAKILAENTNNPQNILIAHPFQPAHMLPLVEVVRHEKTSEEALAKIRKVLDGLHRKVVVLNCSVPGFLVNRFAQALFRESIYLIEKGVTTAEDIDIAMKYAVGMRYASIGLLEYYDAVGFELEKAIAENVYPDLCDTKKIQKTTADGLASGNTGQSAGKGIFDWSKKDEDDFRIRKQSPFFYSVKEWDMPR